MNDEEKEKINPDAIEKQESVKSPEVAAEKESKTLEEELKSQKPEEAINAIGVQAGEHQRDLGNHGANLAEDGEFIAGVKVIDEKAEAVEKDIERLKDIPEKMTLEQVEEFYDDVMEKANKVSLSSESLLEKRKKIEVLSSCMSKSLNDERMKDNRPKTEKWREAGNLLYKIKNDIDKNPNTRKEILEDRRNVINEIDKLLSEKKGGKDLAILEEKKTELTLLYEELDKEDKDKEDKERSESAVTGISKNNFPETKETNADSVDFLLTEVKNKFKRACKSVEVSEYNQTLPNYYKRRVESLNKILETLEEDGNIDKETVNFIKKAVVRDIENISIKMSDKSNIDIYYGSRGKDDTNHEKLDFVIYKEYVKKGNIEINNVRNRLDKIDKKIILLTREMNVNLFADEWNNAKISVENAEKTKNIKERRAYLVVAEHILDSLENGMKDEGIIKASKLENYNF